MDRLIARSVCHVQSFPANTSVLQRVKNGGGERVRVGTSAVLRNHQQPLAPFATRITVSRLQVRLCQILQQTSIERNQKSFKIYQKISDHLRFFSGFLAFTLEYVSDVSVVLRQREEPLEEAVNGFEEDD